MEKKYTPIAMRCNQEQFDAIKPKLNGLEFKSVSISMFNEYPYLINCDGFETITISNINSKSFKHIWDKKPKRYETWNEQIFLESCGIKTEKQMKITKENIIKLDKKETTVRELFPDIFKVDYNEPILSLNDLLSVWATDNNIELYKNSPLFKNFERVAEQKLNNK